MDWWKNLNIQNQISIIVIVISIISLIVNTLVNLLMKRRDIRANIVSKARIEWISEVRILIADYVKQIHKITNNIINYKMLEKQREREVQIGRKGHHHEKVKLALHEIGENILDVNYKYDVIALYFSDNDENKVIINSLHKLYTTVDEFYQIMLFDSEEQKNELEEKRLLTELQSSTRESITICRTYLKKEWEKAKKGK